MLTMSLSEVFVKHDAMADSQYAIYTIDKQEYQISKITSSNDYLTDKEKHDECDTDRTDITSKALCLTFRTKVEDAKY